MKNMLLIDKPAGWTSFDVVAKIRGMIRAQYLAQDIKPTKRQLKVGHTGTLDPFATGLVIILLGDACSQSDEFLKLDKVYEATVRLGETSTTGDPEGEITETLDSRFSILDEAHDTASIPAQASSIKHQASSHVPTGETVERTLKRFLGTITQTPPAHSAIKINGQRAYKLARAGKPVDMPSRQVTIHSLELLDYSYPDLKIRTHVSSGTYIRSLAQDIGQALGTGAYCTQLRRTRVGQYELDDAVSISQLATQLPPLVPPTPPR